MSSYIKIIHYFASEAEFSLTLGKMKNKEAALIKRI